MPVVAGNRELHQLSAIQTEPSLRFMTRIFRRKRPKTLPLLRQFLHPD
jgi:hypothetical protein